MRTPNTRRDFAILAGIVIACGALLALSLHASEPTNWIWHGTAMFTVCAPVLYWCASTAKRWPMLMLFALGSLFPVWWMWAWFIVYLPLALLSSSWPSAGEALSGPLMCGGSQGFVTAIAVGAASRSFWLFVAVALAFIPAHLLGVALSEIIPPPLLSTLSPNHQQRPFLPPIIVLWNLFVALSMWVWAYRHARKSPAPGPTECGR